MMLFQTFGSAEDVVTADGSFYHSIYVDGTDPKPQIDTVTLVMELPQPLRRTRCR